MLHRPLALCTAPRSALRFALATGLLAAVGCTTGVDTESATDAGQAQTHAFLTVQRTEHDVTEGVPTAQAYATAGFLRMDPQSDPNLAARLVGAVPELPAPGTCASLDAPNKGLALHALSPVELVQAGEIRLEATGHESTTLATRAYPDVAHLVWGVVYTSPDTQASWLNAPRHPITLHVAGTGTLPGFDVPFAMPEPVSNVHVIRHGATVLGGSVSLEITWGAQGEADATFVDITARDSPSPQPRWRCTAAESHSIRIAQSALPHALTAVIHRVRTTSFHASTLTTGRIQADSAVSHQEPLPRADDPGG